MRRNALKAFFERVIISSLPLVVAAGCNKTVGPSGAATDLAVGVGGNGGAGGTGGSGGVGGGGGGGGAGGGGSGGGGGSAGSGGSGGSGGSVDMAGGTLDMTNSPDMVDVCEVMHPNDYRVFPTNVVPDGGYFRNGANVRVLYITGEPCTTNCVDTGYTTCYSPKTPNDMGSYTVLCHYSACIGGGRRPEGLEAPAPSASCATGNYFATMAHLEAASVHAFRVMARELVAHGAPAELVADAKRAISDEIRHARLTRSFALAHGSRPAPVKVAPARARSLEEMAVENAAEGCVRETFAALLASWQARAAADPAVRELMSGIASDETRHAELAWNLDSWLKTKLDRAARARVKEARRRSAAALATEMRQPVAPALVQTLGLPDADRARELVAAVERELWS